MRPIRITISVITLLMLNFCAQGQDKAVDEFKVKKDRVIVLFYDPLLALEKKAEFKKSSDKEKSDLLDSYLHNSPLYLFIVTNSKTRNTTYLCIRGNPDKVDTKMFYKVEVIKGISGNSFNPQTDNYSDQIVNVIDKVNCGGTLFEHMDLFTKEEKKKYIGNGISLFGYFRRVQPYSEIKTSMTNIIEQLEQKE